MSWTRISAIAEIVSSVAILATLGYLAVQTQQNTAALVSGARQQSLASELALIRMAMDFPNMLSTEDAQSELLQLRMFATAMFRTREHQWFQVRDGQLDEDSFRSYQIVLVGLLGQNPDLRSIWDAYAAVGALDSEFVAIVEDAMATNFAPNE